MGNDYMQLISFLQMKHGERVHDYSCFAFSCFLRWLDFYMLTSIYVIYDFAIEGIFYMVTSIWEMVRAPTIITNLYIP